VRDFESPKVLFFIEYIHTIEFKEKDYEETVVTTPEEVRQLGKRAGKNTTKWPSTESRCTSTESQSVSAALKIL
jgi:hypothetical protein